MKPLPPSSSHDTITGVAVAVIRRDDGRVLFAQRPAGKACAGEWEFPGGKIEPGETPRAALVREIDEELALHITQARPWITLQHDYPHARVLLHFHIVTGWLGNAHGREGQQLSWQDPHDMQVGPLLAANAPVIRALLLPEVYAISNAAGLGREVFLARLRRAVDRGLKLLQVREPQQSAADFQAFLEQVLAITRPAGVRVLANARHAAADLRRADGLHLTSTDLMQRDSRPDFELVGASCHNAAELAAAARLGLDFVVLSPIEKTPSHPDAETLGAQGMQRLINDYPLPVYALGGLTMKHLQALQHQGAHGIAMLSGAWN